MAPRIVNFAAWRAHLLGRLGQQIAASGDEALARARRRARCARRRRCVSAHEHASGPTAGEPTLVVPLVVETRLGTLSFISTTTVFGTPVDITLAELALESFFPADAATAAALQGAFAASAAAPR
jgi:hypothetical protein